MSVKEAPAGWENHLCLFIVFLWGGLSAPSIKQRILYQDWTGPVNLTN